MTDSVLTQAFVYLAAAVVAVPIAKRFGLGSVLGYLLAGVLIGPFVLGLVGREGEDVMHFAELGVVMMLFLVGLELRPALLWQLRRSILGLGGGQVLLTAAAATGAGAALGLPLREAVAVGLVLTMSSTAIVLQTLTEKRLMGSTGGAASFSILLFQDIAVIPILAVFPLLAVAPDAAADAAGDGLPAWLEALQILGAVAAIVLAGRFVVRPAFRFLASTRLREVFTAAALFLVVGIALLMQAVDLSPALGTFLAGVVLAESEYRHELEGDLEPFKGLLLGLFFLSVGAQIDFGLVAADPGTILALVVGVMTLKALVLALAARLFGLDAPARWLTALGLSQVGEFAFVLLAFGADHGVLTPGVAGPLVVVVALSMALTPLLFIALERLVLPRVVGRAEGRPQDPIEHAETPVVIAGFGRFGQIVGRVVRASGFGTTILDLDPDMVDLLRRLGVEVHYGDATRLELLEAAGCARARLFVVAIDDTEQALRVVGLVRQHFPHLTVLARARNRAHYYELRRAGAHEVFRETYGSSVDMGTSALQHLGLRAHTAHRRVTVWRRHEEHALTELERLWGGDETTYFAAARRSLEEAERLLRDGTPEAYGDVDDAWNSESLRADPAGTAAAPQPDGAAVPPDGLDRTHGRP